MSDEANRADERADEESKSGQPEAREPQGPPPTPFDHPLFLPVLLLAGMIWFGYDGWINADPDMLEHRTFNRVGFAILTGMTGWFGYRGYGEWKNDKAAKALGERGARPGA
ncbi:MAG: hypothetical protein JRG92_04465 [Deltaproteobacteria bacterium]|nr:hypothetical protein [Deltaproteobacteria bacterium]MBW2382863.1 hypothetical protein [Deltaproteobacteria bacterium]